MQLTRRLWGCPRRGFADFWGRFVLFGLVVSSALALPNASAAPLAPQAPVTLVGGWETIAPRFNGTWTLQIESLDSVGRFAGRLSFYGPGCTQSNLAVIGTWSSEELMLVANMSTRCGDRTFRLRSGSRHALEGDLEGGPVTPFKVWLNPK